MFMTIRNADGCIDLMELKARLHGNVEEATVVMKFMIDNNSDGRIDQDEWRPHRERYFESMAQTRNGARNEWQ